MKKNFFIVALIVIIALLVGYVGGRKFDITNLGSTVNDSDSVALSQKQNVDNEKVAEPQRNTAIDFSSVRTYIIHHKSESKFFDYTETVTLFPDYTAQLKDDENLPLNWQIMEGVVGGEPFRFIYIYKMEDTSKPYAFLLENGYYRNTWGGTEIGETGSLNDLIFWETNQEVNSDVPINLFCRVLKNSFKKHPDDWIKCKYKDEAGS